MSTGVGMGSCCLSGKVHEGKPAGREDQIGGLPVYVTEPQDGSKAKSIIFLTDSPLSLLCSGHLPLILLLHHSLWMDIPQRPSPRGRVRQSRLLLLRPRLAKRRPSPYLLPRQCGAQPQDTRDARHGRQGQEWCHCGWYAGSMACQA